MSRRNSAIDRATAIANATTRSARHAAEAPNRPAFRSERAALSPQRRADLLDQLREGEREGGPYDLIVVGAGVTGAGVALDAVTRGLRVLLVDKVDLAFGTSRWSSKLAHGGLRYLASGNVGIARRSAKERGILMEVTAPHLTRALPQVVPVMAKFGGLNNVLPRLGFLAGDALRIAAGTSSRTLPRSRTISAQRVAELCPAVDRAAVKFGYVNYDGQLTDDAALVTALARTAAGYGADVLTHAPVTQVTSQQGLSHVTLQVGAGTGDTVTVAAAGVVNATGVWAGDLDKRVTVTPSRGTHLVIRSEKLGNPTGALTVPVPHATNRFCFVLPTGLGRCYVGITDEAAPLVDEPEAPEADIHFILDVINQALDRKLTRSDVDGAFAGLRPLIELAENKEHTADLSREHAILVEEGMVTVTGGKLTEYRLMAEQTVDAVLADPTISSRLTGKYGPCVTERTPLLGAPDLPDVAPDSAAYTEQCVVPDPSQPVLPGQALSRARLSFAVTHEGARTVSDILDRRTRIGLVPEDRAAATAAAEEVLRAAHVEGTGPTPA
ncbi:glycerol-3-phosphate dehydrogenase/oxidase [Corynebacterium heidelbergense]|uniref:Glycerol-3-phosphate dehydrogenase/oxidase n=1 Tax=Corynebacterium heidelbergense TaxID=2055947 RepID=A0A364V8L8_9CORY|nr:glycerol-3-phosphate dehydrogenase/oxidase [Corynebacterium heidelbergense]RAV32979.1 glycerol-3-phosphate dehydrogenase/oxidase [Corynebacterium heidelbergense]